MFYYAQIDGSGLVVAELQTASAIRADNMIPSPGLGLMGYTWSGSNFVAPAPAPVLRHITVGAFYDRFGAAKWGILADTTPAVQAVVRDTQVRRYIDLDNPQLPAGLATLQAAGHTIDSQAILGSPIQPGERP